MKVTRLTTPLLVSVLIGGVLLTAYVAMVLFPPMAFNSGFDESGRTTEVIERDPFPGGAIVVYKHPISETPKWYISIRVHNYITCEDNLSAYVESRTAAFNKLVNLLDPEEQIRITISFKEPLKPEDFQNLYRKYFVDNDGPNHAAIIVENQTSGNRETIILNAPNLEYLEQFCTYPKEGLKTTAIISFEAVVKVDVAKNLREEPRILFVDPHKCLTIRDLMRKYDRMGFQVTVDGPPLLVRTFEPESTLRPAEESLIITLDKERYSQGETMNITIKNISNETIWFTDTAHNLFFERFNGVDWKFHDAMIGGAAMTPLEPGKTAWHTWPVGYAGRPYPPGQYRVGTHGVYAEFEVIEVQLDEAELEMIIIEFLKTTDVANGTWDGTVNILEVYDHKLGGKVVVVNYTTMNAVHPHFMCEAIEHHTAVITLNEKGEVLSAFCVWGTFHDGRIWDLLNQRWIQR